MPRDGSGVYSKPAGIDASPNTTIESADWNAFTADVEQDLNTARPVVAGGTGSGTAVGGNDNLSKAGADMASATTLNLATATGTQINVTGTTTITGLGTVAAGAERELVFVGSLTLTHNATTLILPGAANIQTAAGDVARFRSLGGGNWRCMSYQRANGQPIGPLSQPTLTLKQSAAPAPTAEGDIQWDTDDDLIVVGDGASQKLFAALPASSAAGDLHYMSSAKAMARLSKGTALQILRMNAGATAPEWGPPPDYGAGNAALSVGAVGTYALLQKTSDANQASPGATFPGTSLRYANTGNTGMDSTVRPSGTWMLMGFINGNANVDQQTSLFLRVS